MKRIFFMCESYRRGLWRINPHPAHTSPCSRAPRVGVSLWVSVCVWGEVISGRAGVSHAVTIALFFKECV